MEGDQVEPRGRSPPTSCGGARRPCCSRRRVRRRPLMCMLRTSGGRCPSSMRLVYSVRYPDDVIYEDEIGDDGVLTYTREAPDGWSGHTGHIDAELLRAGRGRAARLRMRLERVRRDGERAAARARHGCARSVPSASARRFSLACVEDRIEAAREVMRQVAARGDWQSAIDPSLPPSAAGSHTTSRLPPGRPRLVIDHTDAEVVIVQVPEIPDARTYTGHEGLVDALLDWPRQWENFRMTPERIFAPDTEDLIEGRPRRPAALDGHRGRGRDRLRLPRARRARGLLGHVPDARRGARPRCPEPR